MAEVQNSFSYNPTLHNEFLHLASLFWDTSQAFRLICQTELINCHPRFQQTCSSSVFLVSVNGTIIPSVSQAWNSKPIHGVHMDRSWRARGWKPAVARSTLFQVRGSWATWLPPVDVDLHAVRWTHPLPRPTLSFGLRFWWLACHRELQEVFSWGLLKPGLNMVLEGLKKALNTVNSLKQCLAEIKKKKNH